MSFGFRKYSLLTGSLVLGAAMVASVVGGLPSASAAALTRYQAAPSGLGTSSQKITFASTPASNWAGVGGSYSVTATATSGLAVAFSIDGSSTVGACTVSGSTVRFAGVGTCVIDANQEGNTDFSAAPQMQQDVNISDVSASCTIEWTGGTGNWTTTFNWTRMSGSGSLPTSSDVTCIPGGSDVALSSSDPNESAGTLVLGNVDGSGTAALSVDGSLTLSGGTTYPGGSLEVGGGGTVTSAGTFTNAGSISVAGSGATLIDTNTFDNYTGGSIAVSGGGTFTENVNDTFVEDGGTTSGAVTIDAASLDYKGGSPGSAAFSVVATGVSEVSGAPFAGETLTLQPGAQIGMGTSTNLGTIELEAGSKITNGGTITNDGTIDCQVSASEGVTIANGTVVNDGNLVLESGNTTEVTGNFTQSSTGALMVDLGAASGYGNLVVGSASLAGTLTVNTSFIPTAGSTFAILAGGGRSGEFSTDVFDGDANYSAEYTSDAVILTTVSGPPTITKFTPATGSVGTVVTIKGTNLSGATEVTFNGVKGTITSNTGTKVKVKVPSGAATGKIKVVTPGGKSKTASVFTVN